MPKQLIVGVSGRARHGKDTWSEPLIEALSMTSVAFADPLRGLVADQDPLVYVRDNQMRLSQWVSVAAAWIDEAGRLLDATMHSGIPELADEELAKRFLLTQDPIVSGTRGIRYTDLVAAVGYTAAKENPEFRAFLQRTGTEAGRKLVRDSLWVDLAMNRARNASGHAIITDTRFPNEAQAVRDAGGVLVRVVRPGLPRPANEHASETSLDGWGDWDHVVVNDGTKADLHADAIAFAERLTRLADAD